MLPFVAQRHLQQLQVALGNRQQIIEIVGDPAGELADRLQPVGLAQPILGIARLGNVGTDRSDMGCFPVLVQQRVAHRRDAPQGTVACLDLGLADDRRGGIDNFFVLRPQPAPRRPIGEYLGIGFADHVGGGLAQKGAPCRVDLGKMAADIFDRNRRG